MAPAMGVVVALLRRGGRHCCLRQCPCSSWLVSVACARAAQRATGPFLRGHVVQGGQACQKNREARHAPCAKSAHCRPARAATAAKFDLGSKTFPGSLSLRARATGAILGALS